jgi:hypothetical protein
MTHGYLGLVGGLLPLKRRIHLDGLIAAVKFAHMALEAKALVRRAALFLLAHHLQLKQVDRADRYAGAAADALFLINPDFYLDNVILGNLWHRIPPMKNVLLHSRMLLYHTSVMVDADHRTMTTY